MIKVKVGDAEHVFEGDINNSGTEQFVFEFDYGGYGTESTLPPAMITGFDSTTAGVKTITASYEGFTDTFEVVVCNASITGISVTAPSKTSYFVGEDIDLTGGKITVSYNYGDPVELDLTPAMISGFDSTTPGTKTITVSYEGFTDTFEVTVRGLYQSGSCDRLVSFE